MKVNATAIAVRSQEGVCVSVEGGRVISSPEQERKKQEEGAEEELEEENDCFDGLQGCR